MFDPALAAFKCVTAVFFQAKLPPRRLGAKGLKQTSVRECHIELKRSSLGVFGSPLGEGVGKEPQPRGVESHIEAWEPLHGQQRQAQGLGPAGLAHSAHGTGPEERLGEPLEDRVEEAEAGPHLAPLPLSQVGPERGGCDAAPASVWVLGGKRRVLGVCGAALPHDHLGEFPRSLVIGTLLRPAPLGDGAVPRVCARGDGHGFLPRVEGGGEVEVLREDGETLIKRYLAGLGERLLQ
mmetsp:Transcript_8998/g.23596  ORF Transcript_8998/g.23596 Transcript_8998/m.23596 type:complete len:237 (-) Transcript_8998:302-1012(-)